MRRIRLYLARIRHVVHRDTCIVLYLVRILCVSDMLYRDTCIVLYLVRILCVSCGSIRIHCVYVYLVTYPSVFVCIVGYM